MRSGCNDRAGLLGAKALTSIFPAAILGAHAVGGTGKRGARCQSVNAVYITFRTVRGQAVAGNQSLCGNILIHLLGERADDDNKILGLRVWRLGIYIRL